jgi:hypothetical protein
LFPYEALQVQAYHPSQQDAPATVQRAFLLDALLLCHRICCFVSPLLAPLASNDEDGSDDSDGSGGGDDDSYADASAANVTAAGARPLAYAANRCAHILEGRYEMEEGWECIVAMDELLSAMFPCFLPPLTVLVTPCFSLPSFSLLVFCFVLPPFLWLGRAVSPLLRRAVVIRVRSCLLTLCAVWGEQRLGEEM